MLKCGDGVYPRVQPVTAEQTSRQQITSSPSVPYIIHQTVSMHGLIDVDADAATREWLLRKFPEIYFFCFCLLLFLTQEEEDCKTTCGYYHHHHHHQSAAEQVTTRFLHARRSSSSAAIGCSCVHCSFIIPKQSLYIGKVWSMWSTRSLFANGWL